MTRYKLALHIFRRDLRLEDNTALIAALQQSEKVIPCFIFDKRQLVDNEYKSAHAIQFMQQSLHELNEALKEKKSELLCLFGIAEEKIQSLLNTYPIDAVFINRDYTPFSIKRDATLQDICQMKKVVFHCYADSLLHEPEEVLKADQKPYTIFTPFFNKASTLNVSIPRKNNYHHFYEKKIPENDLHLLQQFKQNNPKNLLQGGRIEGLQLLKKIAHLKNYKEIRNFPAQNGTSHLSAHNKFGTVSIREVYQAIAQNFGTQHTLIKELYWRDFFTHIIFHFPHVLGEAFHKKYNKIPWKNNKKLFNAWCLGMTGFPIVDAGMRELNTTGYMHNRVRMIVASFLVKDLHIDWRWGEKYFAEQLLDYDPAVNNGNWQWAASTGCDAQPYFRIFNPWRQQIQYDQDCEYIKHWVKELRDAPPKLIHELYKNKIKTYPNPIVDHAIASQMAKKMYLIK